ncbi:hypothetical protein [Crocosphaera watsonii]|nr:hypothetical protein [Crocosphaera watsonii]
MGGKLLKSPFNQAVCNPEGSPLLPKAIAIFWVNSVSLAKLVK